MSRLTEEMVIARSKQSDLSTIKKLNCWGSELSDVSIIRRMVGVELLALSVNRVSTLADFENCVKLQELYLRKNNIQDINDLVYLQRLPNLRHLWLEENPCVESAGPNYRQIVLRALPNLQKLDNIDVTPDELAEAMRATSLRSDDEDAYADYGTQQQQKLPPTQQQQQQQRPQTPPSAQQSQSHQPQPSYQQQTQYSQQQPQSPPQQMYQQQQQPTQRQELPPQSQQQQYRSNSPVREHVGQPAPQPSPDITEDSISESIERGSMPTSPQQRTSPNPEYSAAEPKFNRDQHRHSYHQPSYDDYYQSDRPTPPFYRHSQTDLTEWEDSPHNDQQHHHHPHHHQQQQQQHQQSHGRHQHSSHPHHSGNTGGSSQHGSMTNGNSGGGGGNSGGPPPQQQQHRRSIGPGDREPPYANGGSGGGGGGGGGGAGGYNGGGGRNGSAASLQNGAAGGKDGRDDWEEAGDRGRRSDGRPRRPESRFNDNASVMSSAVINHYASFHRRPVNRSSNLLSAALCLVKELDYPSLEVVEQVVRCRIDELSAD